MVWGGCQTGRFLTEVPKMTTGVPSAVPRCGVGSSVPACARKAHSLCEQAERGTCESRHGAYDGGFGFEESG